MGQGIGFGIISLMDSDSTLDEKISCLKEFADQGLTDMFFEVIDGSVYKISHMNTVTSVEIYNGDGKDIMLLNWTSYAGDISSDTKEDLELIDIFIPFSTFKPEWVGKSTIELSAFENQEGKVIADIKHGKELLQKYFLDEEFMAAQDDESMELKEELSFLNKLMDTALEYRFLLTI